MKLSKLAFVIASCYASSAFGEVFVNTPGTKAKAMGGAYTAIADDGSANWYNPAGLADQNFLTLEYGSTIKLESQRILNANGQFENDVQDVSEEYNDDEGFPNNVFLAVNWGNEHLAVGAYYYVPYVTETSFDSVQNANNTEVFGILDESMTIAGFSLASRFGGKAPGWFSDVSVGATLEYVEIEIEGEDEAGNNQFIFDANDNNVFAFNDTELDDSGVGYSLGLLTTVFRTTKQLSDGNNVDDLKATFGVTYRGNITEFDQDDISGLDTNGVRQTISDKVIIQKPESLALGVAVEKFFGSNRLTVSTQFDHIDYSEGNDIFDVKYDRYSVGAEWYISSILGGSIAIRGGAYKADVDTKFAEHGSAFGDTRGYTAGLMYALPLGGNNILSFEGAYERRELIDIDAQGDDFDADLVTFSVRLGY
jgi:long-subunit fatty acid transport protein